MGYFETHNVILTWPLPMSNGYQYHPISYDILYASWRDLVLNTAREMDIWPLLKITSMNIKIQYINKNWRENKIRATVLSSRNLSRLNQKFTVNKERENSESLKRLSRFTKGHCLQRKVDMRDWSCLRFLGWSLAV